MGALETTLRSLLDLALPPHCPACGSMLPPGRVVCDPCDHHVVRMVEIPHCPVCMDAEGPARCARCISAPPPFHTAECAFLFGASVRDAVHRLKFQDSPWVAQPLWTWAYPNPPAALLAADALVPLPLHANRHRERGYDQARLLAQAASRASGVPVLEALVRHKSTAPVAEMDPTQRAQAVQGAFGLRAGVSVKHKRVVMVDDVVTTSATARAAAAVLLDAGANQVDVVGIARGGSQPD